MLNPPGWLFKDLFENELAIHFQFHNRAFVFNTENKKHYQERKIKINPSVEFAVWDTGGLASKQQGASGKSHSLDQSRTAVWFQSEGKQTPSPGASEQDSAPGSPRELHVERNDAYPCRSPPPRNIWKLTIALPISWIKHLPARTAPENYLRPQRSGPAAGSLPSPQDPHQSFPPLPTPWSWKVELLLVSDFSYGCGLTQTAVLHISLRVHCITSQNAQIAEPCPWNVWSLLI